MTLTMGPDGNTFFAIFINNVNLSSTPRLFDIVLKHQYYTTNYVLKNSTTIALEQCTLNHLNYAQLASTNQKLPISAALCPPLGQQFEIKGKVSSDLLSYIKFSIHRCDPTTDPTCAPDALFQAYETAFKQFELIVPVINNLVNAGQQNYRSYYLEDQNRYRFGSTLGVDVVAYIQDDTIVTD